MPVATASTSTSASACSSTGSNSGGNDSSSNSSPASAGSAFLAGHLQRGARGRRDQEVARLSAVRGRSVAVVGVGDAGAPSGGATDDRSGLVAPGDSSVGGMQSADRGRVVSHELAGAQPAAAWLRRASSNKPAAAESTREGSDLQLRDESSTIQSGAPHWLPRTPEEYSALPLNKQKEVDAWMKLAQDLAVDEVEQAGSERERYRKAVELQAATVREWAKAELQLPEHSFLYSHIRMLEAVAERGGGMLPADGIDEQQDTYGRLSAYEERAIGGKAEAAFREARPALHQGVDPGVIDDAFDVLLCMANPASAAIGAGLIEGHKWIVVTMGAKGAVLFSMRMLDMEAYDEVTGWDALTALEKRVLRLQWVKPGSAIGPEDVVSVTGAGDCLAAAMVRGIAGGGGIARSVALGLAAGARAVQSEEAVPHDLELKALAQEGRDGVWAANSGLLNCMRGVW